MSSLPSLYDFALRHLHIRMLRIEYTVPTRCRHWGGMVEPLGYKACRAIRSPISHPIKKLDHSVQNHPKPVNFLPSGVSSGLTPLNPTFIHTYIYSQPTHLASIVNCLASQICHNRLIHKNLQQNLLHMISIKVSSLATHSTGYGRSSDSAGIGNQSAREPPPCLNTKKCAGEKHNLSDCLHTGKDEAMALLSEYKKKRDADKKMANFKSFGNNRAPTENRDAQTAYLTAENLRVKVTVLADTGSDYSAIPRSAVEDARKRYLKSKCCRSPSC
jgi:hypothetical protein